MLKRFQAHNRQLLLKRSKSGKRGILGIHIGWVCRIIVAYKPGWCKHCTDCQDVKIGYKHKGQDCYCRKVQYDEGVK